MTEQERDLIGVMTQACQWAAYFVHGCPAGMVVEVEGPEGPMQLSRDVVLDTLMGASALGCGASPAEVATMLAGGDGSAWSDAQRGSPPGQ